MIIDLGTFTVGQCLPAASLAFAALEGNLNNQLALNGNLKLTLTAGPPSVEVAGNIAANVMASVTSPTFGIALDANVSAIASIDAQLAALAGIFAALGTAGIELIVFQTAASSVGSEVQTVFPLPGGLPSDQVYGILLACSTPAAFAALQKILKTS